MNIFVTDIDPVKSAKYLDNKRMIKMILESCQLLSTSINVSGGIGPYKTTHINHPCSVWARSSKGNYVWLLNHFEALCNEYTAKYGKIHKCNSYLPMLKDGLKFIPDGCLTKFVNCTTFKHVEDVHEAYRLYLNEKWSRK